MKKEYKRYLQRITGAYKRKTPKLSFQGFSRILGWRQLNLKYN